MSKAYWIPKSPTEIEYEIKKSRFLARAEAAESREQAFETLLLMQQKYPDARHHCWAYQIGSPFSPTLVAMNDDGEPSGTAGRPILNVIQHKEIGNLMVVVSRYFGGIKLGAGGLVRAYSSAAEQAISALTLDIYQPLTQAWVHCDFSKEQIIRHWLQGNHGQVLQANYSHEVILEIAYQAKVEEALLGFLAAQGATLRQLS